MARDSENSTARGYDRRWRKLRLLVLHEEPLCRMCREIGKTTLATVVDHIKPRSDGGGNERENLQPLCAPCHNGAKAVLERTGKLRGCDVNGVPLDPGHHWR